MEVIITTSVKADIQFSIDELRTLKNALNEVCHGIKMVDFEAKIGVSKEEATVLLDSIYPLIGQMKSICNNPEIS